MSDYKDGRKASNKKVVAKIKVLENFTITLDRVLGHQSDP